MSARGFIGYDWFKLAIAAFLALLLLWLGVSVRNAPTAAAPAAAVAAPTAAAPAAPVAVAPTAAAKPVAAPQLSAPAPGAQVPAGSIAFSGNAEPGAEIQISIDGAPIGKARAGNDGAWSLSTTIDKPGDHTVVVQTLDSSGGVAAASSPAKLAIVAPAPQIAAPTLTLPSGPTTAGSITLSGAGTPGAQVDVLVDGKSVGTAKVGADGKWSLPIDLLAGAHEITVNALDSGGNVVAAAGPARLEVAPARAPAITFPADGAQLAAGPFTMAGAGAPGSRIEILDSDKVIGTVTVGADGTWSFPVTPSVGTASYGIRPVGAATVATTPIRVTIGATTAPTSASLAAGGTAWVTRKGGLRLRLRDGAGLSGNVLAFLPPGTQLSLLEGPQDRDGYGWWRVRTLGGREGWVAGSELRPQPD